MSCETFESFEGSKQALQPAGSGNTWRQQGNSGCKVF